MIEDKVYIIERDGKTKGYYSLRRLKKEEGLSDIAIPYKENGVRVYTVKIDTRI